ncbi:RelA/SpoT domain-containing protein [Pseudochrobactrum algeriensis]|uniref:RelA/SpoT domain-containing protein n=1 Tax=Pseudochrobactrum algeriensis TaxID=2834768 RepID=UPI001BD168EA|nr:RelA/SpoT domain-containing protein [Pseudochrobactrum algeriensis]QVQ37753.1 RelA/SpoT domain-containing protein [Pseudochrobactrum algeriensis]QVQ40973.1 RelA/SpoT domain-containing protein [Pseudochrobactrum algeriensis]QVQ44897.1 RelA/SpoT domain-containing protein [Pseudochrobactrum algeriensis]
MGWPAPTDSKNSIRKAGRLISTGAADQEHYDILNRWRMAHGYLINTFQANLRGRTKGKNIVVGQRLKRGATIVDKLQQGRAVDLATMHDIAGIRLTFPNVDEMAEFRAQFHTSRAKHKLVNDIDKYNYISRPKGSGYRGIHDVYRYHVGSENGVKWNGLLIEVQYRTAMQHAWATAVEMADMLISGRTKFSQGAQGNLAFFQICSELLARKYEKQSSCLPDLTYKDLVAEWHRVEGHVRIFERLKGMSQHYETKSLDGFVLLILPKSGELQVEQHPTYFKAVSRLISLEIKEPDWDIVLVSGDDHGVRSTYRNYFGNANEFISMIEECLSSEG